ncbi:MAG: hypothetical protein BroJett030_28570 [Alphaproteobacteria bacterium]|nr:MAG: hypothetical protein BroJett030_28570 [Alphaproteobacteria bacterium]
MRQTKPHPAERQSEADKMMRQTKPHPAERQSEADKMMRQTKPRPAERQGEADKMMRQNQELAQHADPAGPVSAPGATAMAAPARLVPLTLPRLDGHWRVPVRVVAVALAVAGAAIFAHGSWLKVKAVAAQVLLERAFAQTGRTGVAPPPWPWADIRPLARLTAPRLGASAIVLDGASGEALAFGPARVGGTPEPGARGTSVIAGHRDSHFAWIGGLAAGDRLTVSRPDGTSLDFEVRRAWVARYDETGIDAAADERLMVLATCWPLDGSVRGPLRYIVEAVAE